MKIRSIKQASLKGKRAVVRVDYNLPFKNGKLDFKEDLRIRASIPTIKYLLQKKSDIVLISHLGRPEKKSRKFSLLPIARHLQKELGEKINFIKYNLKKPAIEKKIKPGINMLENIRFYKEELSDDEGFAKKLAELGDIFVNEAFSVSHRNQASICCIQKFLPAYAGITLEQEIKNLSRLLPKNIKKNNRPYVALMGGAKISTKINLIESLLKSADNILLGGALISNLLKQKGYKIGSTFTEKISTKIISKILKSKKIILPVDIITGKRDDTESAQIVELGKTKKLCGKNEEILDIGPKSVLLFSRHIKGAKSLVWNGPVGYFENRSFAYGSYSLARLIAAQGKGPAYAVVGGGETLAVLSMTKMEEHIDWISTGGGAMLAYLAGEKLPGLEKIIN